MPQCKAKFCTVKRGQGISTFPIPDPKKNKQLCEQWINKLGIENLNIKTFKFSRDSIVCAKHFEDSCFKEDMQLIAAAKKKGNEDLMPWVRSISNHLWYCASQCMGDADLMEEMWTSIVYHMQNIHEFEGKHFTHCGHDTLSNEEARKKKWLNKGSKALKCLKDIVHDKRLLKDIKQLNLFCHTGELESYHSMMLKYAPKRLAFGYPQMVARTQLAAIDHNFNLKRAQAMDADGNPRYDIMFPKATGRWTVRKLYVPKNYDFRIEMMTMILSRKEEKDISKTPHQLKKRDLPKNIARLPQPLKPDLVEAHVSRFKLND